MPRRLLIAIDFDGTLLGPDGQVSAATKASVRQVIDAGHEVVFATGRTWHECHDIIEQVDHRGKAVFVGGAFIVDTQVGKVLHRQGMAVDIARELCRIMQDNDVRPLVLLDREGTGFDYAINTQPLPPLVAEWHERHAMKHLVVEDLVAYDHKHTMRLGTFGPPDNVTAVEQQIEATFGERVLAYKIDLANVGVELLEVFDPSVNKWAGVERVAALHDIDAADVVGIGDDMNDLHLLEGAGIGVAMGNAKPPVKAIADKVIGKNADDGLAIFLSDIARATSDEALAQVLSA